MGCGDATSTRNRPRAHTALGCGWRRRLRRRQRKRATSATTARLFAHALSQLRHADARNDEHRRKRHHCRAEWFYRHRAGDTLRSANGCHSQSGQPVFHERGRIPGGDLWRGLFCFNGQRDRGGARHERKPIALGELECDRTAGYASASAPTHHFCAHRFRAIARRSIRGASPPSNPL